MAENDGFAMGYALGQDNNGSNRDGMFGGDWIWAFLIFALFGWGNGGWGGFGGGNGGGYTATAATQADIQRGFDTSNIIGKLDGINNGLCDGFYAVNTSLLTGFNNTNMGMMQGFNGVQSQLCNMAAQQQSCCCETQRLIERGFADTNYNMATNTRDIIESQNAGTRAILDYLCQEKISDLQAENQSLKLAASQAAQNAFFTANQDAQTAELIRRIAPAPVPAYAVPAPYPYCGGYGYNGYNGGCNSCGC